MSIGKVAPSALFFASLFGSTQASCEVVFDLSAEMGYRQDDFNWNIAGPGDDPNILSELSWTDMDIPQGRLLGELTVNNILYIRAAATAGSIANGDNRDSDYGGNNRSDEFLRSENSAGGEVSDASAGIGLIFPIYDNSVDKVLVFVPQVGYSLHHQRLEMTDGFEVIGSSPGPFDGLGSSYDADWEGVWYGFDFWIESSDSLTVEFRYEYHDGVDYYAEANWNLATRFEHPVSFTHEADADGYFWSLGLNYLLSEKWSFHGRIEYFKWESGEGIDTTFFSAGFVATTKLNVVNWESTGFMVGLRRTL